MTRRQALMISKEIISLLPEFEYQEELMQLLEDMKQETPGVAWTEAAIYDAIEQFRIDHNGRLPNLSDFNKCRELPSLPTIKNRFKVTSVNQWMDEHYPDREYIYRGRYNGKSPFEWLEDFREQYLAMKDGDYVTEEEYNRFRKKGSPSTKTLGKLLKTFSYNDILMLSGVDMEKKLEVVVHTCMPKNEMQLEGINQGITEIFDRVIKE